MFLNSAGNFNKESRVRSAVCERVLRDGPIVASGYRDPVQGRDIVDRRALCMRKVVTRFYLHAGVGQLLCIRVLG